MDIQILSDLHLEFHQDPLGFLFDELTYPGDVIVIAGDLTLAPNINSTLHAIAEHVYPKHVIYVYGNHDLWGEHVERPPPIHNVPENLHILNNSIVTINGQRFVGGTGWYDVTDPTTQHEMLNWADVRFAHNNPLSFIYLSKAWYDFLGNHLEQDDIVVSHMLPSYSVVDPQYLVPPFDRMNKFFVNPCDGLIEHRKPKLWIHGHTHTSVDQTLFDTRVVCNPYGYYAHDTNSDFVPNKIVKV